MIDYLNDLFFHPYKCNICIYCGCMRSNWAVCGCCWVGAYVRVVVCARRFACVCNGAPGVCEMCLIFFFLSFSVFMFLCSCQRTSLVIYIASYFWFLRYIFCVYICNTLPYMEKIKVPIHLSIHTFSYPPACHPTTHPTIHPFIHLYILYGYFL